MLVGYPVAKPVLNVLGLLSGIYVFTGNYKSVCWKELRKIVAVMAAGIIGGILLRGLFIGKEQALYRFLGIFVIFLAVRGGLSIRKEGQNAQERSSSDSVPAGIAGPLSDTDSGRYRTRDFRIGRPASDQLSDKKNTG